MKKFFIVAALIVLIAVPGWLVLEKYFRDRDTTSDSAWTEAVVKRRDISSSIRATGIIKPMVGAEVRVGSRVSGVVTRLHTNVGDEVSPGQLLAELDSTELQARLDQSVAALERARAEVEYARTQLGYAQIRAPIAGVVASVSTQEGETVAASFTTPEFVTIMDLDRLELRAHVDETDIGRVSEGQRAQFTVDTYPETDFEGTVTSVYPDAVIENTVVNYITIISIGDRQGNTLRPEMTANVTLFLETREDVLTVPRKAIRRDRGRYVVSVVRDGTLEEREVRVGWRDNDFTEIVKGLAEGETVAIGTT